MANRILTEGRFLEELDTRYIDGRKWRVLSEFDYHLGTPDGSEYVRVPAGFVTDFASIPQALWAILPPTGSYGKAAVIHDWLYQKQRIVGANSRGAVLWVRYCHRAEADAILNEAMDVLDVGRATRWTIYSGVRIGGWVSWNNYRNQETKA